MRLVRPLPLGAAFSLGLLYSVLPIFAEKG